MRHGWIVIIFSFFFFIFFQSFSSRNPQKNQYAKSIKPPSINKKNTKRTISSIRPIEGAVAKPSKILTGVLSPTPQGSEDNTHIQVGVNLSDKEKLFFELAGEKVDSLSDSQIYHKTIEKYRSNDEPALNAFAHLLLNKFPRSIYCDNVLYLQGMFAFSQKKYGDSLSYFQKILDQYPQSNKAVSALFAKGVVFKKMNLNKESVKLLAQVINQYPGSPESSRAEVELKIGSAEQ